MQPSNVMVLILCLLYLKEVIAGYPEVYFGCVLIRVVPE